MNYDKVITINDSNNVRYKNNIEKAMDSVEMAIYNISYGNNIDEDTNKPLNANIIERLNNIIYELEDCLESSIVKIYKKGN